MDLLLEPLLTRLKNCMAIVGEENGKKRKKDGRGIEEKCY